MGDTVAGLDVAADPSVVRARGELDALQQQWVDLGVEAGMLVASTNPVGGQIVDGISLASNLASGNYGGALLDGIGFIPFGGDAIKGFFRGRRIARDFARVNDLLGPARRQFSKVQEFARRRMAAAQHWARIRRQRQEIINRYHNCNTAACRRDRDAELGRVSRLPTNGRWVDANGNPVPAGTGRFVPNDDSRLYDALSDRQNPVTGIPYNDGVPDLSGFPPPGRHNSAPDGSPYSVEIEQSLTGDRTADRNATWGQWREDYPDRRDPSGGQWHHDTDGVTMTYVDADVHGALAHEGGVAMNTSPGF